MQNKLKAILVLSLVGVLLPFVGVSIVWRIWFAALLFLTILILAYRLYRHEAMSDTTGTNTHGSEPLYVETKPVIEESSAGGESGHESRTKS